MSLQLNDLNSRLGNFAKRFVVGLTIVRGNVEILGRLERSRSWHTDSRSGTIGKFWNSGFFGAGTRGSSDTQELITHTINLLKIDSSNMSDVTIASTAMYDALGLQDKVACVFSYDKSTLYYLNNFSNGISIGFQPNWSHLSLFKWACLLIGGFVEYASITSFSLIGLAIGLGLIALGWVFHLALKRSLEIWEIALQSIQHF